MLKLSTVVTVVALALTAALPAYAKKDAPMPGGSSPQHMSQPSRDNANSPVMGQEKGGQRALDRKSEQGIDHGITGQQNSGKSMGHEKDKAKGQAKGHYK